MRGHKSATTPPTRGLSGADLEREILDLSYRHADLFALRLPDGSLARPVLSREVPVQGARASIPPGEMPRRWAEAVASVRRDVGAEGRITAPALAHKLGVSVRTVERYRPRLGLG